MHDMKSPLIFGEIVFGRYKFEKERPGGSSYNVAWHLKGFGLDPIFISRIGIDSKGREVIDEMEAWGLNTEFIQHDTHFHTGSVNIEPNMSSRHHKIRSGMSFDFIDKDLIDESLFTKHFSLIYHSTLSLRSTFSLKALAKLKARIDKKIYFDANLIAPWWREELIVKELEDATWVKCSERELKIIGNIMDFASTDLSHLVQYILKNFNLEAIIVPFGEESAFIITNNGDNISVRFPSIRQIMDISGKGDAYAAVSIIGLIYDWPSSQILHRANEFATHITQVKGALLNDKLLYGIFKEKWDLNKAVPENTNL